MSAVIDRWRQPGYGDVKGRVICPRIPRNAALRGFRGVLCFFCLNRKKDWREATTYYERVLALELKARQMVKDVFDTIVPDDFVIDWSDPDCLPNLKKMAEAGQAEARQVMAHWYNNEPLKDLSTNASVNNRPEVETDNAAAKNG